MKEIIKVLDKNNPVLSYKFIANLLRPLFNGIEDGKIIQEVLDELRK